LSLLGVSKQEKTTRTFGRTCLLSSLGLSAVNPTIVHLEQLFFPEGYFTPETKAPAGESQTKIIPVRL
jgi:hypothetical protein